MKKIELKSIEKIIDEKLIKSTVKFNYIDDNTAKFDISNNNKNIVGSVTVNDNTIYFDKVESNYSKKYLTTLFNKSIKDSGFIHKLAIQGFSSGTTLYLSENEDNQSNISNFYYYGYDDNMQCKEQICYQSLGVTYLGIEQRLCEFGNYKNFSKYRVN